jgi:hypothetical protein
MPLAESLQIEGASAKVAAASVYLKAAVRIQDIWDSDGPEKPKIVG